jgi:hypothetical protein
MMSPLRSALNVNFLSFFAFVATTLLPSRNPNDQNF